MTNENPQQTFEMRKGIYQELDAQGKVLSDERWRLASTRDGGMRGDIETVRIAPFSEPRSETLSLELSPTMEWRLLAIHALHGRRECRAEFSSQHVNLCSRLDATSRTREFTWTDDCEIDYNSPLFTTVTLRRMCRAPGEVRALDVLFLDRVTFEPRWVRQTYTLLGAEWRETRFGVLQLDHYQVDFDSDDRPIDHFWCDRAGVVFDYSASAGGGFRLAAVNFPV